jgi:hypothetical protein
LCNGTHSCFLLSNILWTTKDPVKIGSSHYCSRGIIILIVEYTAVFNHPAITLTNRCFFEFCLAQQLLCSTQRSHSETFRTCPETSWRRKLPEIQPTASAVYFGRKRCETLNFGLSEVNIGTVDRDSHIKCISTLPCNIYGEVRYS